MHASCSLRSFFRSNMDTREEIRRHAAALLQGRDSICMGAYVHVKSGVRGYTQDYENEVKMFTAFIRSHFPQDPFLTIQLQRSCPQWPHKDNQNSYFPTLLCNLSPGAPGGTWIEHSEGSRWVCCEDRVLRRGTVMTGLAYRFSARTLWHMAILDAQERIVLLAWVPSGWASMLNRDLQVLATYGFVLPDRAAEERCRLSTWGPEVAVQRSLHDSWATKAERWPAGWLVHDSGSSVHICLSSDEEESSPQDMDNVHASLSCIETTDLEENSETNSDVFTYFDTEVLACD